MQEDEPAIRLKDVAVTFGHGLVLNEVSLDVARGQAVALLGPSGCGKTTLLRVITGGLVARGAREIRGKVGVVYQDLKLLPWMTVLENVMLSSPKGRSATEAMDLLKTVGISGKAEAYPYELSGGQRQRVAIARALASGADILLLDEPFSALDFVAREHLRSLVRRIHSETGFALVVVTHDIEDATALADRLLVMRAGKIVGDFVNDLSDKDRAIKTRSTVLALYEGH